MQAAGGTRQRRTSGKPDRERYTRGGRSSAARPQCNDADDDGREGGRMKLRYSDDLLRDPSRRFAIAGIVLASALACWSGGAFGAEMPKELWGYWCHKDKGWVRCKEETWDGLCCFIDRKEMASEHTRCKTLSVRKVKDHTWVIKQRCAYGSVADKKDPDDEGSETTTTQYERRGVHLYAKEIK
jgi:hypothetical protein